ncbi:MAG: hypothetical protein JXR61_05180 [Prolixibacteraceae bacterium]|nr:hypothetical protein [Prolixibacteraceae bacterium]
MKWYKLLLIAVIALAINACNSKPKQTEEDANVKYFRNLQFSETPWDVEKGTHPLSADEATEINNYKFTYNDNNQLVSVEYNRNGVLLNYSSMGAAKIVYSYEGDKQLKKFYNEKGEDIKNSGVLVYEYTLENEMRVALRFLDENGEPVENRNNIHNYIWSKTDDNMIRELRYNLAGDSTVMNQFCPFYELRFSYDENGYVTRMANYDMDTLYNCTAENCGDNGVSYFEFQNNENGDLVNFSVHNATGLLSNLYWGWAKRVNVVDEYGYVIETTLFDQDNEYLGGKNVPITKTVYNKQGAPVKRIALDEDKNVVNNPNSGVAIEEFKYDDNGLRIETLRYDKDNVLITNEG